MQIHNTRFYRTIEKTIPTAAGDDRVAYEAPGRAQLFLL